MIDERHRLLLQHEQVDLKNANQVELWTDVLGIYTADLFNAVAAVGVSSAEVLRYILEHNVDERTLGPRD